MRSTGRLAAQGLFPYYCAVGCKNRSPTAVCAVLRVMWIGINAKDFQRNASPLCIRPIGTSVGPSPFFDGSVFNYSRNLVSPFFPA